MTSKIYVHAPTVEGYRLAGRAQWHDRVGTFEYAPDWLARTDAYALDPRNLPLVERVFTTLANDGVFGVLADAGPDAWGKRVIEHCHRQQPTNPLEYLISGNGDGVGALRFSLSRDRIGPLPNHLTFQHLEAVAEAERDLEEGRKLDDRRLQMVWEAGSSMGGARPKFTIGEGEQTWLVKLARHDDLVDMAVLEHACLQTARTAGLDVPDSHVATLGHRSALFVRRFDRRANGQRVHYLSAHALLNRHKLTPRDVVAPTGTCTYGNLAAVAQHSLAMDAGEALFQRMLFNLALGNTDDHGRNLGFLKSLDQPWQLAPAFDLTVIGGPQHALGLGTMGREATLANALSDLGRFRVSAERVRAVVDQTVAAVATLPALMKQLGATEADVTWTERRLPALGLAIAQVKKPGFRKR